MHKHAPANSIFDGSVTNPLSVLYVWIEILSRARAQEAEQLEWFQTWHFYWSFSEWRRSKHSNERVKLDSTETFFYSIVDAHNHSM